jgi:hypothetical protein
VTADLGAFAGRARPAFRAAAGFAGARRSPESRHPGSPGELEGPREIPDVEEVLHAAIPKPERDHRLDLLGDRGLAGVDAEARIGHVGEEHRVGRLHGSGRDRVAESEVHLQWNPRDTQAPFQCDANAVVNRILPDGDARDGGWKKGHAVGDTCSRHLAKDVDEVRDVGWA